MDLEAARSALQQGPDILLDRWRLRGLLNDASRNNHPKVNVLLAAYDIGILDDFKNNYPPDKRSKARMADKVSSYYSVVVSMAEWAVSTWCELIDENILDWLSSARDLEPLRYSTVSSRGSLEQTPESPTTMDGGILIPCGIGKMDNGFIIRGLAKHDREIEFESVYAVIFNYLQRSTIIDEHKDKPEFVRKAETNFELDYKNIFRLAMVLLSMVKSGYAVGDYMPVQYDGSTKELKLAIGMINDYAAAICSMTNINYRPLRINGRESRTSISISGRAEIYAEDYVGERSGDRVTWYAPRIVYSNIENNPEALDLFLHEISPFESFRPGQRDAICSILSSSAHSVHIMPTGSGKSLIFYLANLLQPCPSFVVCPTDLLVRDQLRNLKIHHRIDHAAHLVLDDGYDFSDFKPANKLIYLTPETFQNSSLLKRFITLNQEKRITSVVLDEIHSISNWSHDFRPEYLMLSTYLSRYLDRTYFWGFTATADYTVVKDLCNQLEIERENVFTPVDSGGERFSFSFHEYATEAEMCAECVELIRAAISCGRRTLVFTKGQVISERLWASMGSDNSEVEVFAPEDPTTYHFFADNKCSVLIASDGIGIGVNLPDVTNVIHFGVPISKAAYVQEIGRAGRNGEAVTSHVIVQSLPGDLAYPELMNRNTPIDRVVGMIDGLPTGNDYVHVFQKLMGGIPLKRELLNELQRVAVMVKDIEGRGEVSCPVEKAPLMKRCLYVLFLCGYVSDWWIDSRSDTSLHFRILTQPEHRSMINMRNALKNYFYNMGLHWESVARVPGAKTLSDLLGIYADWYYSRFLYHHREQFLDMVEFVRLYQASSDTCQGNLDRTVQEHLKEHFRGLRLAELVETVGRIDRIPIGKIMATPPDEVGEIEKIEKALADRYNLRLDLAVFSYYLTHRGRCDPARFNRILSNARSKEFEELMSAFDLIYTQCSCEDRFALMQAIERRVGGRDEFLLVSASLFRRVEPDCIFYGIIARVLRERFGEDLAC